MASSRRGAPVALHCAVLDFCRRARYILAMRSPKKRATAAKLRNWRVSILRNRAEYLGTVEAADAEGATVVAAETFKLDGERRKRLAVREDG
jgi:hypothetical protein